jgi:hypothetical protein
VTKPISLIINQLPNSPVSIRSINLLDHQSTAQLASIDQVNQSPWIINQPPLPNPRQ